MTDPLRAYQDCSFRDLVFNYARLSQNSGEFGVLQARKERQKIYNIY